MNPDYTLARLRRVFADEEYDSETVENARELFEALDAHLSAGGPNPSDWGGSSDADWIDENVPVTD